jgi:hypothetical protein
MINKLRVLSLFSLRRIWGLGILAIGLLLQLGRWGWTAADYLGRLDVLWRIVETMGGTPALFASVISSWQFSLALIVIGLAYTIFVGEPEVGTQRHAWWPYAAASVFFVCVAVIASVSIYGWFEVQLRRAYDQGQAGLQRSTPDVPRPNQPSPYSASRELTPDQIRILIAEFSLAKDTIKEVHILVPMGDSEAIVYSTQLRDVLQRSGIMTNFGYALPFGPDDVGLSIRVPDPNALSPNALRLLAGFEVANIHPRVVEWRNPNITLPVIYIGPRPLT